MKHAYNDDVFEQVGFGMDFPKDPFTLKLTGSGQLHPVLEHAFDGVKTLTTNPYVKVGCN